MEVEKVHVNLTGLLDSKEMGNKAECIVNACSNTYYSMEVFRAAVKEPE